MIFQAEVLARTKALSWGFMRCIHSKSLFVPWQEQIQSFPGGPVGEDSVCDAGDFPQHLGSIPGWVKIPRRRKWQLNPVFLPGKSYGQRSLPGCSPWGLKRVGHDWETKPPRTDPTESRSTPRRGSSLPLPCALRPPAPRRPIPL